MRRRPFEAAVMAIVLMAAAAIAVVVAVSLFVPGMKLDAMWRLNPRAAETMRPMGRWLGAALAGVGLVAAVAGLGLWGGRRWGWGVAVALFAVNGAGDLVSMAVTRDWIRSGIGVVAAVVFLAVLLSGRVRAFVAVY
jgi:hypothetical protein